MTTRDLPRLMRSALVAASVVALVAGCRKQATPAIKPTLAAATVNGATIPAMRVQAEVDRIRRGFEQAPAQADPKDKARFARAVLDALVDRTLLLQRAHAAGIDVSDAEVQRATDALAEAVRRGGETFAEHLTKAGITSEQLADEMRDRLLAEKYVADQTRRELPSKAEIRAYYDTHRGDYEQPETARVQEITVRTADEAKSLLDQLRKGAIFDELAKAHGITPDARGGGDLGWIPRGRLPKEFDAVAFSLAPGKLSGVIHTDYGYSVLKVLGRRAARNRTFDEVKSDVERRLTMEKHAEAERQLLAQLRDHAEVQVNEAALALVH